MKIVTGIMGLVILCACTPTPTELPEDFDPEFAFFLPQKAVTSHQPQNWP